jgi:hypothetical protein
MCLAPAIVGWNAQCGQVQVKFSLSKSTVI